LTNRFVRLRGEKNTKRDKSLQEEEPEAVIAHKCFSPRKHVTRKEAGQVSWLAGSAAPSHSVSFGTVV